MTNGTGVPAPHSFRDPDGFVEMEERRVLRWVHPSAEGALERVEGSLAVRTAQAEGRWIPSEFLSRATGPDGASWIRVAHPKIEIPAFPQEWSPAMLAAAGTLTLDLSEALLGEGLELKDATPRNILFQGTRPIHVDHLSPRLRVAGQMGWVAYGQFVRTFLLPLLLNREAGIPLVWGFLAKRDGISPEEAFRCLGPGKYLRPSLLQWVTLPARLTGKGGGGGALPTRDPEVAEAVTRALLRGLRRALNRWAPQRSGSHWSKYTEACESYTSEGYAAKVQGVAGWLERIRPLRVLDLGCNTGDHALSAAAAGASVVALDLDEAAIDILMARAQQADAAILPMVANLGRPTPATGWLNAEESALLDRLKGGFDAVLGLALIHHLLVSERIPLGGILDLFADLTRRDVLLEFVGPEDPMFRRLAGPNQPLYAHLDLAYFEREASRRFDIVEATEGTSPHRRLYWLRRK